MKIDKFNEHVTNNKYAFKTKEQLDEMSKEDLKEYRYKIIHDNGGYTPKDLSKLSLLRQTQIDWKQYLNELEVYQLVRFKQDKFNEYDQWTVKAEENDTNKYSELELETFRLLSSMANKENGKENMFNITLKSDLEKVGEFKHILGIEYDEKIKNLFNKTNGEI